MMDKATYKRLVVENKDLWEKLRKLIVFMHSDEYAELPFAERRLIDEQRDVMQHYIDVLSARISLWRTFE